MNAKYRAPAVAKPQYALLKIRAMAIRYQAGDGDKHWEAVDWN